jgi:hypothetical protein
MGGRLPFHLEGQLGEEPSGSLTLVVQEGGVMRISRNSTEYKIEKQ